MQPSSPSAPRPRTLLNRSIRATVAAAAVAALSVLAPSAGPLTSLPSASAATTRPATTAGALAVGAARYAVPAGAVYASPKGSDSYPGTSAKPVKTITRALAVVKAGGTIVLRAGTFHETVTITTPRVTIQNYPGEAVWLDGSVALSGWTKSGKAWRHPGWLARFDSSPTYTKGAPDGTAAGWQFVNPAYPMAAHPEMVFLNGVAQRQVRYLSQVTAGTFFVDTATSNLYLGSDPTKVAVRGTTVPKAISVRAADVQLRGFGVRRFGNSVWHMGAITLEQPRARLTDMRIEQMATTGLAAMASDVVIDRVDVIGSGMLGIHAATADRLQILRSRINSNNLEHFNIAPVAGGIKVGRLRTITVSQSQMSGNYGPGFWADQSVYDTRLGRNNIEGNTGSGVFLEISSLATVVDNLIARNWQNGIKVNNTSNVRIWNNTVVNNSREINIVADSRLASNTSWGHDPRYPNDPTMTWVLGPVEVRNNVLGRSRSGNCVLCVEDYTFKRTAAQIGVTAANNFYNRPTTTTPKWSNVWSTGTVNPAVYTTLATFQRATAQERSSIAYDGIAMVTTHGVMATVARTRGTSISAPLPSALAPLAGQVSGARRIGVWGL